MIHPHTMKRAVSVSLGSSTRDAEHVLDLDGEQVLLQRVGTDGDERGARERLAELDGQVDALGIGGIELYIRVEGRDYPFHGGLSLLSGVTQTPAVDGRGLKQTLERRVFELASEELGEPRYEEAFMVLGVDRYGMAEAVASRAERVVFGDLMYGLGIPLPIVGLTGLRRLARLLLPVAGRLPIWAVYPTGAKQEQIRPRYRRWQEQAELIAGDFHFIRRHLIDDLGGRTILTNTTTPADVELLRARGLRWLVTTTPRLGGRSFGTNALEAALTALAGHGRPLSADELSAMIERLDLRPNVQRLNP